MSGGRGRVGLERECMFKLYIIHDIIALDLIHVWIGWELTCRNNMGSRQQLCAVKVVAMII